MKTFTDNASRTWTVAINVSSIKRVKDTLDVNLLEAIEGHLLERLVSDPVLLCDLLFVLCKPEADAKQVTDEEFGQSMAGDAIDRATTALLEELVNFFPSGKRGVLASALAKLKHLETRAIEIATERLESPELAAHLEKLLAAPGDLCGNSADNSDSIPARSP
jgi:hypothetical protein